MVLTDFDRLAPKKSLSKNFARDPNDPHDSCQAIPFNDSCDCIHYIPVKQLSHKLCSDPKP